MCNIVLIFCGVYLFGLAEAGYYGRPHNHGPDRPDGTNPTVRTPSGQFIGSYLRTRRDVPFEAYRGIPYAEPPVGDLRFEPPVPIHRYERPVNASVEGPACPTIADEYYYGNFSEDCLRLNVYTPQSRRRPEDLLPVVVFIHAGGFYGFSGRTDVAGPEYLMERPIVLVTINYRLGSLGFISTGDELAPGNNGMKDQAVALKWIKKNIAHFGGDPNLITLTGCSAGSISVMLHMISPMTRGLFHRGISMSAAPTGKGATRTEMRDLAVKQAELLDCPTNSSQVILDCLRTKTWREIGDSLLGFYEFGYDPVGIWLPIVEQDFGQPRFLDIEPADAIKQGRMKEVPYIITQTREEFAWKAFTILENATLLNAMNQNWTEIAPISFQLPRDNQTGEATAVLRKAYLEDKALVAGDQASITGLGDLYSDSIIGFTVHRCARLMSRHSKQPVYHGLFSYVGEHSHYEDPVTNKPIGAMHHDDLIYLLGLTYRWPLITADSPDSPFVDTMTALWYQFAKYGDLIPRGDLPELSNLHWPRMTEANEYLVIDRNFTLQNNLFEDRYSVWDRLYPIEY